MENKTCKQCGKKFEITDDDLVFYSKMAVSTPTLCPDCRVQRRLAWRNEKTLYKRKCDLCQSEIISIMSPDKKFTVYCPGCWWSDNWDPLSFGRDYNPDKPFFEQLSELQAEVPTISVIHQRPSENCTYTSLIGDCKNSYMIFAASFNEDCYYSNFIQRSKDCIDCFFTFDSEHCYGCVDCYNGYELFFSQNCENCAESYFLFECRSCRNCIGCAGLQNKQYYIFNKQATKEEYEQKLEEIKLSKEKLEEASAKFKEVKLSSPHKYYSGMNNENCVGDHISSCKNTFYSFDVTGLENCKYCHWFHKASECYDCYGWGLPAEMGYEIQLSGYGFNNLRFCYSCGMEVANLTYCNQCNNNSKNLFGCIGLSHKEYCILNKQYSRDEYDKKVAEIEENMKKRGEWGEFFPVASSYFCYNESMANVFFPLEREVAKSIGAGWLDIDYTPKYDGSLYEPKEISAYKASELERDNLLKGILKCGVTNKPFKVLPQELAFYIKYELPIPTKSFDARYLDRFNQRNPRKLFKRQCMNEGCTNEFETTYAPDRPEKVYCESCYQKEVL